jgi:copper chaperone CopZ
MDEIKYPILKATLEALIEAAPGVVKAPAKFVSSLAEQLKSKPEEEIRQLEEEIKGITKDELEAIIRDAGYKQKESIETIIEKLDGITKLLKLKPEKPPQFPLLPSLHNQTPPEPNFVGRRDELATITQWYRDKDVHIGVLVGWGGFGKSALARRWYDLLKRNKIHPDAIFW